MWLGIAAWTRSTSAAADTFSTSRVFFITATWISTLAAACCEALMDAINASDISHQSAAGAGT